MKTRITCITAAVLMAALLTSCPETKVSTDFGKGAVALKKAEWEGNWGENSSNDEDGLIFTVTDAAKGQLTAKGTKKDDKPINVYVRTTGAKDEKLCFITYTEATAEKIGPLRLARLPEHGVFLLFNPDDEAIIKAVKSGELKGKVTQGEKEEMNHSVLDNTPENWAKILDGRFWKWSEPGVMVRRGK